MIGRAALRTPGLNPLAGPSRIRHLSAAAHGRPLLARPTSAVALGKRPAGFGSSALLSRRNLSLFPRTTETPASQDAPSSPQTPSGTPATAAAEAPTPPETEAAVQQATAADVPSPSSTQTTPTVPSAPTTSHDLADPTSLSNPLASMPPDATLGDMIRDSGLPLEDVLNAPEAVHAAASIADYKLAGMQHGWFSISGWGGDLYLAVHDLTQGFTGSNWVITGALSALFIRLILLRFVIRNFKNNSILAIVGPSMQAAIKGATDAQKEGNQAAVQQGFQEYARLKRKHGVGLFSPLALGLIQGPFFYMLYSGAQRLADLPVPGLKDGGILWFTDLTVSDPYYILPALAVAGINITMRLGPDGSGVPNSNETGLHLQNGVLLLSPLLCIFMSNFPAFVFTYWITTNIITMFTALIFARPAVRKFLNIAPRPKHLHDDSKSRPTIKQTLKAIVDKYQDQIKATQAKVDKQRADYSAKLQSEGKAAGVFERINEAGYEGPNKVRKHQERSKWDDGRL